MLADARDARANLLLELTTLPLDLLKIAAPLMPVEPAPARTGALLPELVAIARRLGLKSVAQGLDHPGRLRLLRDLDCAFGQGALHGGPVDASAAHSLLAPRRERRAG